MARLTITVKKPTLKRVRQSALEREDGAKIWFTWAPTEVSKDGVGATWTTVDRPGRRPVVVSTGKGIPRLSFTATIGSLDPTLSVASTLAKLDKWAEEEARVRYLYSAFEQGWWRIESLTTTSTRRTPTGGVQAAEVSITLVRDLVPVKAGTSSATRKWRSHTWKKGDTWAKVSVRYLGKANRWREIARANQIKKPKAIKPGRRLRIPPR